jgi:hypothetical protein
LLINKPLGLSPRGIEFRRAYLYDINPVGLGAMTLASLLAVAAHLGALGEVAQALSPLVAMCGAAALAAVCLAERWALLPGAPSSASAHAHHRCVLCQREYEAEDIVVCPAYQGHICSLCCTLDVRCGDLCKPQATLAAQWQGCCSGCCHAACSLICNAGWGITCC